MSSFAGLIEWTGILQLSMYELRTMSQRAPTQLLHISARSFNCCLDNAQQLFHLEELMVFQLNRSA
jgi:hypothetical protein